MADGTVAPLVSWPSDGSLDTLYARNDVKDLEAILLREPASLLSEMSLTMSPDDGSTATIRVIPGPGSRLHGIEDDKEVLRPSTAQVMWTSSVEAGFDIIQAAARKIFVS